MIDYSILNPTEQIWLNLELYFKSYEFYNFLGIFWNFYEFILIYFRFFLMFKIIKKMQKWGYVARGPMWMWRGTQGHVALPRGRARLHAWRIGRRVAFICIII